LEAPELAIPGGLNPFLAYLPICGISINVKSLEALLVMQSLTLPPADRERIARP
jgi:hypothetical protein